MWCLLGVLNKYDIYHNIKLLYIKNCNCKIAVFLLQFVCRCCGASSDPHPFTEFVHYVSTTALWWVLHLLSQLENWKQKVWYVKSIKKKRKKCVQLMQFLFLSTANRLTVCWGRTGQTCLENCCRQQTTQVISEVVRYVIYGCLKFDVIS